MSLDPIVHEETFRATPDELFDAFVVPHLVTRWLARHADIDARSGGWWTLTWPPHDAARGRYLTIERPSRIVSTWNALIDEPNRAPEGGEVDPGITRDYAFEQLPDGQTRLTLKESGHRTEAQRKAHANDIDVMFQHLRAFIEQGERVDWTQAG